MAFSFLCRIQNLKQTRQAVYLHKRRGGVTTLIVGTQMKRSKL